MKKNINKDKINSFIYMINQYQHERKEARQCSSLLESLRNYIYVKRLKIRMMPDGSFSATNPNIRW